MDLRELRVALRRNWAWGVLAFLVCLAPGFALGVLPSKTYAASVEMAADVPTGTNSGNIVQQANFLIPQVVARIESRTLKERAAQDVPEPQRSQYVRVTASATDSIVTVRGEGKSPSAVAAWVNAVAGLAVEEQAPTAAVQLTVIDDALPPRTAFSPQPIPILVGAGMIGIIAALFTAVLASRIRASLDSASTVRHRLGTTVLGEVPNIRGLHGERRAVLPWLMDNPPGELVEAFQSIRTNMEFRLADLDARTIVVTSYQASAGKSTISTGIAWSLAQVGRSALLLDADLRRPTLHDKIGIDPGSGLADMINQDPASLVQHTIVPNLDFVAAGLPAGRPADIVARALPRALDRLDTGDRLIVIDSPPLQGVAETPLVVGAGKYVVLVLDAKSVELPELGEAVFRLQDSGAVILGVVINRVRRRRLRKKSPYYGQQPVARQPMRRRPPAA